MFEPLTIEVVFAIRTRQVKVILSTIRIRYLICDRELPRCHQRCCPSYQAVDPKSKCMQGCRPISNPTLHFPVLVIPPIFSPVRTLAPTQYRGDRPGITELGICPFIDDAFGGGSIRGNIRTPNGSPVKKIIRRSNLDTCLELDVCQDYTSVVSLEVSVFRLLKIFHWFELEPAQDGECRSLLSK